MNQLKQLPKSGSKKKLIYFHSHDNDDSYAKSKMSIEHVNDDCLTEIFMYVPAWERPKFALVCKKWKRALYYSWFNVKKLELTHWEYDEYPHFLKRNFSRLDEQFNFLKSLFYKCGHYLTELDLSAYAHCNILPVINEYCQNLEKLRIRIIIIDEAIFDNSFSHLSKLKVLKIIFHYSFQLNENPSILSTLFNALLNVADTLTDLNISNWISNYHDRVGFPEDINNMIPQLTSLTTFSTSGILWRVSLIKYISNSKKIVKYYNDTDFHLEYCYENNIFNKPMNCITKLNIRDIIISDDYIYCIANTMRQLSSLKISCSLLTDTGIVSCTKMNNLEYLLLNGFNNMITDSSIKLLKNLKTLKLPFSNKITDESAIKVLENSPKLFRYCVENTGVTHKFIEKAAEISMNHKRVILLWVTLEPDMVNIQDESNRFSVHYSKKKKQQNEN